jgi:hypothetical protein
VTNPRTALATDHESDRFTSGGPRWLTALLLTVTTTAEMLPAIMLGVSCDGMNVPWRWALVAASQGRRRSVPMCCHSHRELKIDPLNRRAIEAGVGGRTDRRDIHPQRAPPVLV